MIEIPYRRQLLMLILALVIIAGVGYDSLAIQPYFRAQLLVAACVAAGFATIFLLQRYPRQIVQPVLLAAWPLHLYSLAFVVVCVVFHGRRELDQVIVYTAIAYASYLLVPLMFLLDRKLFQSTVGFLAVLSAMLAIPTFAGAFGLDSFLGLPIRNKLTYADWSGIIASGGIFEHGEGNAYQMAIGLFCSLYVFRVSGNPLYAGCLLVTGAGLVISQGRAAILGVGVALAYFLLPELFRRSRPIFLATLLLALLMPFFILNILAAIPGVAGYLRVHRGLSGRDEAWKYAVSVMKDRPWKGYGFMVSAELTEAEKKTLRKTGFSGAGTTFHNTFVTKAVDLGLVVTGIYTLLYLVPLLHVCRGSPFTAEESLLRSMLILTLTTSIFRDYNIGGIRSTTMIGSIFLGLGCLWKFNRLWEMDWAPRATATTADDHDMAISGRQQVTAATRSASDMEPTAYSTQSLRKLR